MGLILSLRKVRHDLCGNRFITEMKTFLIRFSRNDLKQRLTGLFELPFQHFSRN
jgi:hypothetical protein